MMQIVEELTRSWELDRHIRDSSSYSCRMTAEFLDTTTGSALCVELYSQYLP